MILKLCNCAECGQELLGDSMRPSYERLTEEQRKQFPPPVDGRVNGRPYCAACLRPDAVRAAKVFASRRGGTRDGEPSPSLENAVRHLEDG